MWHWAKIHENWLSAAYIPGESNVVADFHSRHFKENTEWTLNPQVFRNVCDYFTISTIDLFAAANNNQVETYVSWLPDPGAYAVDAITFLWIRLNFYAVPPFSMIAKVLAKIIRDKATGWMIVPKWVTQSRFPVMLNMLINPPLHISPNRFRLTLPNRLGASNPLVKKLHFLAVHLSGNPLKPLTYQQQLQNSSSSPGGRGWGTFCDERKMESMCPTINDILTFLTHLYGQGKEYNTIAMTKSVLSSIVPLPRG